MPFVVGVHEGQLRLGSLRSGHRFRSRHKPVHVLIGAGVGIGLEAEGALERRAVLIPRRKGRVEGPHLLGAHFLNSLFRNLFDRAGVCRRVLNEAIGRRSLRQLVENFAKLVHAIRLLVMIEHDANAFLGLFAE